MLAPVPVSGGTVCRLSNHGRRGVRPLRATTDGLSDLSRSFDSATGTIPVSHILFILTKDTSFVSHRRSHRPPNVVVCRRSPRRRDR